MCILTQEISSKIDKLHKINNEIASFKDDLVREDLLEEPREFRRELHNAQNYSSFNKRKEMALQATLDCMDGALKLVEATLYYMYEQKKERHAR